MKRFQFVFLVLLIFNLFFPAFAENDFSKALRTCNKYTKTGSIPYKNEIFNLTVTLEKNIKGICIYKEKIHQDVGYQLLTCNFSKAQLPFIADSMERFNQKYKKEIEKNTIFEAKLTTNNEVFQKYLTNPEICKITYKKY